MRRAIDEMVQAPYLWWWLKRYNGAEQVDFTHDSASDVETVRLRASFEHGGKINHGLHVHILIEIGHRTMVQISKKGVCDIFRHFVGLNPNVNCRFVKGSGEDKDFILRYITKEIPSYKPESQLNSRLKYAMKGGDLQDAENSL